jgi:hypothetical protein
MAHFSAVADPREGWRGLYPLLLLLLLVVVLSATLAGMEDFVEIKLWGEQRLEVLRRFDPYERGVLLHDTLNDLINALDPPVFKACFIAWVEGLRDDEPDLIVIDAKTSRRSHGRARLHRVSAWARRQRLLLRQEVVDVKSNEIIAIPRLLVPWGNAPVVNCRASWPGERPVAEKAFAMGQALHQAGEGGVDGGLVAGLGVHLWKQGRDVRPDIDLADAGDQAVAGARFRGGRTQRRLRKGVLQMLDYDLRLRQGGLVVEHQHRNLPHRVQGQVLRRFGPWLVWGDDLDIQTLDVDRRAHSGAERRKADGIGLHVNSRWRQRACH